MRAAAKQVLLATGLATGVVLGVGVTHAQTQAPATGEKTGRYVMSPIDGGFARLDTETGVMSICKGKADSFKCELAPDSTAGAHKDAEKSTAEIKELRAEIKRMEDLLGLGEKNAKGSQQAEEPRPGGPGGSGFKLPTEAEVDQALDYFTRMVKKFKSRLKELEHDGKGNAL